MDWEKVVGRDRLIDDGVGPEVHVFEQSFRRREVDSRLMGRGPGAVNLGDVPALVMADSHARAIQPQALKQDAGVHRGVNRIPAGPGDDDVALDRAGRKRIEAIEQNPRELIVGRWMWGHAKKSDSEKRVDETGSALGGRVLTK
jgi:hypothetical protein